MSRAPEYQFVDTSTESLVSLLTQGYEQLAGATAQPGSPERLFIHEFHHLWEAANLQKQTQLYEIMDIFCADLDHLIPATGDASQDVFMTKLHKRFAHRRLAHSELLDHLSLGENTVWLEESRRDFFNNALVDLVL